MNSKSPARRTPAFRRKAISAVIGLSLCATVPGFAESSAAQRSASIRSQIDALLKIRRQPVPLPLDPPNPFIILAPTVVGAVRTSTETARGNVLPEPSTAAILASFASELRISGMIRLNDQVQIIINDNAWKEGDYITIERGHRVVRLQVARIMPGQLTLRLNDAELVIRF